MILQILSYRKINNNWNLIKKYITNLRHVHFCTQHICTKLTLCLWRFFFRCCYILVISLKYNFFELISMVLLYNTPNNLRCSFGPIPESISILGELTAPAETITSLLAIMSCFMLSRTNDTPVALLSFIMIYTGRIKSKINNLKIMVWFYRIMNIKLSHLIKSFNFYYCVCYNSYT